VFNNKLADQIFLKACYDDDQQALDQWSVQSYWTEVVEAIRGTLYRYSYTRVDNSLIRELSVNCTSRIYEQYMTVPSRWYDLKTVVRGYAIFYTKQYVQLRLRG